MWMHRVVWRGVADLASACVVLLGLATCTPVREPAKCQDDADCQSGFRCSDSSRLCTTSASVSRAQDAAVVAELPSCRRDADCETSGPCESVRCERERCVHAPVPSGMVLPEPDQVVGDCRSLECDGKGHPKFSPTDADLPMSDGNPCHARSCDAGEIMTTNLPDGSDCNAGGVCENGECSKCFEGADCTGVVDCKVMRVHCSAGHSSCDPTDELISGKTCGASKVCSEGECTDCKVGASCQSPDPCYVSRIVSCAPQVCERTALTGTSCGSDADGNPQVCNAGKCVYACDKSSCNRGSTNPCMQSMAACDQPESEPVCSFIPVADGLPCDNNGSCHNGTCTHPALVNGDFARGFDGWTLSGDAQSFVISSDGNSYSRLTVSTWVEGFPGGAGSATGSVSQTFVVPDDAFALRFNVWGGDGTVQLRDANGGNLERVNGADSLDNRIPVSWDLSTRRGQTLTIVIEDNVADDNSWAYVNATGFDVIRAVPSALVNGDFHDQLVGWETTGDGMYFNVYNDWNMGAPDLRTYDAYGRRMSVSSYVRSGTSRLGLTSIGTVSQTFTVPADATALRFNVCGGKRTHTALYDGAAQLYAAAPNDDDSLKVPISWDLTPHRGKALRMLIVDEVGSANFDYLGVSGFDIITAFNGP